MQPIGILTPTLPYNFALLLSLLTRYAHPTLDICHDGAYWRVLHGASSLILCRVSDQGAGQPAQLSVAALDADPEEAELILGRLRRILGLDDDRRAFYAFAQQHPPLWEVVRPLVGLRWIASETVFEALITTIIEQQIAWVAAQKAQRWLLEWGGQGVLYEGRRYYAFPTPGQLAHATLDDLKPLKITFKRMQVMIDIAQAVYDGRLNLEALRHLPAEVMYQALVGIKGVGHWTATWTLQRTRGQHNYVGANDVALQAAVNHYFYGQAGKLPAAQVQATFAQYGEYAGLAANYTIVRWVLDRYPG